jgi:YggT family protein
MSIIGNAILWIIDVMELAIFVSVVMSWIPQTRDTKFASILSLLTEPVLGPVRTMISKLMGGKQMMLDFSPIVAIVLLGFIGGIVKRLFV